MARNRTRMLNVDTLTLYRRRILLGCLEKIEQSHMTPLYAKADSLTRRTYLQRNQLDLTVAEATLDC